jgi:hypothetical protein
MKTMMLTMPIPKTQAGIPVDKIKRLGKFLIFVCLFEICSMQYTFPFFPSFFVLSPHFQRKTLMFSSRHLAWMGRFVAS